MSLEINVTDQIVEINEVSNPVEISVSAGASVAPVWGAITGTLSNQTDLQNALNAKISGSGVNGRVGYWSGTNTQTSSSTFLWDNTLQNLTIGSHTYTPSASSRNLTLGGSGLNAINFVLNNQLIAGLSCNTLLGNLTLGSSNLTDLLFYVNNTFAAQIFANTRNVLIQDGGTFTDNGARLQVTGSATIASSGSGNTATINHSSGSGIGLNITKDGNGEGLYINKTSGSGNAATIIGTLNATSLVKSGGTSTQYLMADGSVSTLTNPITGTGTSGQVSYWSGTSTQAGSANLVWDNVNSRLSIGNITSTVGLNVANGVNLYTSGTVPNSHYLELISNSGTDGYVNFRRGGGANGLTAYYLSGGFGRFVYDAISGNATIGNYSNAGFLFFSNSVERGRFTQLGNFHIGTFTTDSGQRLQVTGDTLLKGSGNTSATTALTVQNSDGTALWRVKNDGDLQIGNTSEVTLRPNNGSITSPQLSGRGLTINIALTSATGSAVIINNINGDRTPTSGVSNTLLVQNGFAPTSGTGLFSMIAAQGTINQTGGANGITRGLYVNPTLTAAADWRSIEWSNNTGWGLYGAGTSNNYLGGSLGIGSTANLTGRNLSIVKNITGAATAYSVVNASVVQSDVTGTAIGFYNVITTQNASFTLLRYAHFDAQEGTIGASSTVTNNIAYRAHSSLTTGTNIYGFKGEILSGTGRWNLYCDGTALNYINSSLLIGSTTDSGEKLQVTGTMKVTGASSFGGNMTLSLNQNAPTSLTITNTSTLASAQSRILLTGTNGSAIIGKTNINYATFGILSANDTYLYNFSAGDIAILNDFATGSIKFAAGGSSTAHMTIKSNGRINMSSLPTSATGLSAGDLWNDGGTLKIV